MDTTDQKNYPYQLVTFFDRAPAPGEFVYQGVNGWYPQLALKRRFAFVGLGKEQGIARIEDYLRTIAPFDVRFGERLRPAHMPVDVVEVSPDPAVMGFHMGFIRFMGSAIVSRFPERDGANYYPHMTVTWDGRDVVDTALYVDTTRTVGAVWILKDDGLEGDSRALRKIGLGG